MVMDMVMKGYDNKNYDLSDDCHNDGDDDVIHSPDPRIVSSAGRCLS